MFDARAIADSGTAGEFCSPIATFGNFPCRLLCLRRLGECPSASSTLALLDVGIADGGVMRAGCPTRRNGHVSGRLLGDRHRDGTESAFLRADSTTIDTKAQYLAAFASPKDAGRRHRDATRKYRRPLASRESVSIGSP